jgi:hypothetical protein
MLKFVDAFGRRDPAALSRVDATGILTNAWLRFGSWETAIAHYHFASPIRGAVIVQAGEPKATERRRQIYPRVASKVAYL